MSKGAKVVMGILFVLVLLSLSLNGLLLWQWWSFQQQARSLLNQVEPVLQESLTQAISDLDSLEQTTIQFDIQVEQEFPVEVEIPFNQTLTVPIQTTIPISDEIQTTIMLDPFQAGLSIPTDVTVPVNLEVPINLTIPVTVDRTIPISTTVPLAANVPIAIEVNQTELAPYLARLRTGLESLRQALSGLER